MSVVEFDVTHMFTPEGWELHKAALRRIEELGECITKAQEHVERAEVCHEVAVHLLQERIARARKILEPYRTKTGVFVFEETAKRALEALEGK